MHSFSGNSIASVGSVVSKCFIDQIPVLFRNTLSDVTKVKLQKIF